MTAKQDTFGGAEGEERRDERAQEDSDAREGQGDVMAQAGTADDGQRRTLDGGQMPDHPSPEDEDDEAIRLKRQAAKEDHAERAGVTSPRGRT